MHKILIASGLIAAGLGIGLYGTYGASKVDPIEFQNHIDATMSDVRYGVPDDTRHDAAKWMETTIYTFRGSANTSTRKIRIERADNGTTVVIGSPSVGHAAIRNGECVEVANPLYNGGCRHLTAEKAHSIYDHVVAFDQAQQTKKS